ncbi:hypothetical protein HYW87_04965, partial [Candidatus Roizmanbacteria bacterium]|nr:hypothetical protein [Candidatus Roizmanbacteria bacterium]
FIGKDIIGSTNKEMSLLIIACFLLIAAAIFARIKTGKIKFTRIPFSNKEEFTLYILTSFFFAYFLSKSFLIFSKLGWLPIIFFTTLLFFLLPNIVEFYLSFNIELLKQLVQEYLIKTNNKVVDIKSVLFSPVKSLFDFSWRKKVSDTFTSIRSFKFDTILSLGRKLVHFLLTLIPLFLTIILRMLILIALFVIMGTVSLFLIIKVKDRLAYERKLRENLTIMKTTPKKTAVGEKIVVEGYNFGWRTSPDDTLMSSYGPVIVELWKDQEIVFYAPLHWQEGKMALWIERRKETTRYSPISKSNTVYLDLLSRWYFYPEEKSFASHPFLNYWERIVKKVRRTIFSTGYF